MSENWYKTLTQEQKIGYKIMYPNMTYKQILERMEDRFGIILPPPLILTSEQCEEFKINPSINPITKKKLIK